VRDFKNIDRLFQENLKDFEVSPPNEAWDAIENRLMPRTKKNKLPFWFKLASIAALFVLFFSAGTIYFLPKNNFSKNLFHKQHINKEISNSKDSSATITVEEKLKAMQIVVSALSKELAEIEHNSHFTANAEEKPLNKQLYHNNQKTTFCSKMPKVYHYQILLIKNFPKKKL